MLLPATKAIMSRSSRSWWISKLTGHWRPRLMSPTIINPPDLFAPPNTVNGKWDGFDLSDFVAVEKLAGLKRG